MLAKAFDKDVIRATALFQHITILDTLEGFFGNLKNEFFYGRDWRGVSQAEFIELLDGWLRRYSTDRIKYFKEESGMVCDTIDGRRRRLGYAA